MPLVIEVPDTEPVPELDAELAAALQRFLDNNKDVPKYLSEPARAWLAR
jgi:hypothetical protein